MTAAAAAAKTGSAAAAATRGTCSASVPHRPGWMQTGSRMPTCELQQPSLQLLISTQSETGAGQHPIWRCLCTHLPLPTSLPPLPALIAACTMPAGCHGLHVDPALTIDSVTVDCCNSTWTCHGISVVRRLADAGVPGCSVPQLALALTGRPGAVGRLAETGSELHRCQLPRKPMLLPGRRPRPPLLPQPRLADSSKRCEGGCKPDPAHRCPALQLPPAQSCPPATAAGHHLVRLPGCPATAPAGKRQKETVEL